MIVRYLPNPPRPPGPLLFVPSLSLGSTPLLPPLGGRTIPAKDQFISAFLNDRPNWFLRLPRFRPSSDDEVSPESKNLLTGDDQPHPGEVGDLLQAGLNYAKPFIAKQLDKLIENYSSPTAFDRIIGCLVLTSVIGVLAWSPSRSLIYQQINGQDVPVCDWMTIAIGPKSLDAPSQLAAMLPPRVPNSGGSFYVKVTIDLSRCLQNFEANYGKPKSRVNRYL